jgi:hypothetical protein
VKAVKENLEKLRESYSVVLENSVKFCELHGIDVPELDEHWRRQRPVRGRPSQNERTYRDFYRQEVFMPVIDQLQSEMSYRFNDEFSTMMDLASSLRPDKQFSCFDAGKIYELAGMFLSDFQKQERSALENELRVFKETVRSHPDFVLGVKLVGLFLAMLISSGLSEIFPYYCRLLRLVLTLPITTASTERSFSAMKIVKTRLRTSMGDQWMVDLLQLYIEKDLTRGISVEHVIDAFKAMKSRRI